MFTTILGLKLFGGNGWREDETDAATIDSNMEIIDAGSLAIQSQLDAINVNTPQAVETTAPIATLYMVTIYIASRQDGDNSQSVQPHILFTDFTGLGERDFAPVLGVITGGVASFNSQNFSVPFYAKADTRIAVSTAYVGGGTPFHYDIGVRIVKMPQPIKS